MSHPNLDQILMEIGTLDTEELEQIRHAVQERLAPDEEALKRKAFHQALIDSGLVKQIKPALRSANWRRPLIPHDGKPVSETIIEERR